VRVWVGDALIIDRWTDGSGWSSSGAFNNTVAGSRQKIRVDYYENTGSANLSLYWTPPGGSEVLVPGSQLSPRYGLRPR
ncbi:MAG: PA14 domain-containing protein, partial [Actinobacteria bacterium]|nr:PA14 domain-containing protein [Actinomycetota bacterium]